MRLIFCGLQPDLPADHSLLNPFTRVRNRAPRGMLRDTRRREGVPLFYVESFSHG